MSLPNGRLCKGCGKHIIFKRDPEDGGKTKAYEPGDILHKCPKYEELQRLSNDRGLIEGAKSLVAVTNHVLRKYRLELQVIELEGDHHDVR